jgi:hypothetical protein
MKIQYYLIALIVLVFFSCETKPKEDLKNVSDKIVFFNKEPQWRMDIPIYWNVVGRNEKLWNDVKEDYYILYLENDEGDNTFYAKTLNNYRVSKDTWKRELPSLKNSTVKMATNQNVTIDTSTTQVKIGGADFDRFQITFLDSLGDTFRHRYLYTNYYQDGIFTVRIDYGIGYDDRIQGQKMVEAFESSRFKDE